MKLRRLHDLATLRRRVIDALAPVRADDEADTFELAQSARRFSRKTKEVVDDKLSFSATLMRAGEVDAANRLLAEVENEVLNEEAALLEQVNEVTIARVIRREKVTRMHLARTLAVAVLGAGLMSFSALGMALASMIAERTEPPPVADNEFKTPRNRTAVTTQALKQSKAKVKHVRIAGQVVAMSSHDLQAYKQLTTSGIDSAELSDFLFSVLPASVAQKVHDAIAATNEVQETGEQSAQTVEAKVVKVKKKAGQAAEKKEEETTPEQPSEDPTADEEEQQNQNGGSPNGGGDDSGDDQEDDSSLPLSPGDS